MSESKNETIVIVYPVYSALLYHFASIYGGEQNNNGSDDDDDQGISAPPPRARIFSLAHNNKHSDLPSAERETDISTAELGPAHTNPKNTKMFGFGALRRRWKTTTYNKR